MKKKLLTTSIGNNEKNLPEPSVLTHGNKISSEKIKMPTRFILTYVDVLRS